MLWLVTAIYAADLPSEPTLAIPADPPLAIPADPPPPPIEAGPPQLGRVEAMRRYGREALVVRPVVRWTVSPGTTTWSGGRWGWGVTTPPTAWASESWAIYQGNHAIDVPTWLGRVGDAGGQTALERRIRTNRTVSAVCGGGAAVGVGAVLAGAVGTQLAASDEAWAAWSNVTVGGISATVVGLVGGSIAGRRADRLRHDPALTLDSHDAEARAAAYNERLAESLGLTPEEAYRVEATLRAR